MIDYDYDEDNDDDYDNDIADYGNGEVMQYCQGDHAQPLEI